ncbi:probable ATP-dependent RNA helicase DDX43 [Limulus polyphemus]|uniref:Probable ATP-dependent RNA helicase DDX43 n=1 Tax=Limulus polyphemus TaxID=6850 RepID=A0ABM1B8G4_LIMPO|nr:probable ATP-dependent RNA helicase DDX43 [Limulus polyphemus]
MKLGCDTFPYVVGAVISHSMLDGRKKPVSIASNLLTLGEQNYDQIYKEALRYENNNIVVSKLDENDNRPIPNPVWKFEQGFEHFPEILDEINKQGFEHPSPVQCQSWPILLQGYDMIGIAQTGTGKTIAFLLPAFIHIDNQVIHATGQLQD